ncbi:MAG: DUF4268 domain-containing protein [Nakamurella sp.]
MDTRVLTPQGIFLNPTYFAIPIFQRPYVWNEEDQWTPLWQDVRRMAELHVTDPNSNARHFLGAIVLHAQQGSVSQLSVRNVIDGQQRLTTLLLLMDAAEAILQGAGQAALAGRLQRLTHIEADYISAGDSNLKLIHANRDRSAFEEVMNVAHPVTHGELTHRQSLVSQAHRFFSSEVALWLGDQTEDGFAGRARALVGVLTNGLQLVTIDLQSDENPQEIFETLNARGTPLTSADLIKNFVFQRLLAEGADVERAYEKDWPFEDTFWETNVSAGNVTLTRGSLFLGQWLSSRIGEEVSPRSTFTRFKHYIEVESGRAMTDLLQVIKRQSEQYRGWMERVADLDVSLPPLEMTIYRMSALSTELLTPVLLWLHDPDLKISPDVAVQVIAAIESWIVRRSLLRLPSSGLGRTVDNIIRVNREVPADELPDAVSGQLAQLNSESNYWPDDDELREALQNESAYNRFSRSRLRMFLETVENRLRSRTNQPQVTRRGFPIEHLLPQTWQTSWPVTGFEAERERDAHVHRLGNLTLLTTSLNSSVSNGPWEGPNGKRAKLREHDTFLLNSVVKGDDLGWDEAAIDARTATMVEALIDTWPVPVGHVRPDLDEGVRATAPIDFRDIVASGLIAVGTRLIPRAEQLRSRVATVTAHGLLELDGQVFESPSAAGTHLLGRAVNGWVFWRLEDGARIDDIRTRYRSLGGLNPPDDSPTKALYRDFWRQLTERLVIEQPSWISKTRSTQGSWLDLYLVPGVYISLSFTTHGLGVWIYFGAVESAVNLSRFEALQAQARQFDDAAGRPVEWDVMKGRKATRVGFVLPGGSVERTDSWPEISDWIIDSCDRLHRGLDAVGGVPAGAASLG